MKNGPYSIPFLSVLHQNKAMHNFRKKGQRSIVERNIGLQYTLIALAVPNFSKYLLENNYQYCKFPSDSIIRSKLLLRSLPILASRSFILLQVTISTMNERKPSKKWVLDFCFKLQEL